MSALSWYRVARKVAGLSSQPVYPNFEALLELEGNQPHEQFRLGARIAPPIIATVGAAVFIPLACTISLLFLLGTLFFFIAAGVVWFICDYMDRAIPETKRRLRKAVEPIWHRYFGFANIVGVQPTLSPKVAAVLDEAAGIYLKHVKVLKEGADEPVVTAVRSLEDAMARLVELGEADSVQAQELELDRGWAQPLLQEMRELDQTLDRHTRMEYGRQADPIAGLRNSRLELERIEEAVDELRQSH